MHHVPSRAPARLVIFAIAAAAACSAHAQTNVQVYGLLDVGVESLNHASATGGGVVKTISGGMNTSRWGFRGSEDLGLSLIHIPSPRDS